MQKRFAKKMLSGVGHLGRKNPKLIACAEGTGLSVHQLQSFARGRRKLSDAAAEKVRAYCWPPKAEVSRERFNG